MSEVLFVKITDTKYIYGIYLMNELLVDTIIRNSINGFKTKKTITLDSAFVHYLTKEITLFKFYRKCFLTHWKKSLRIVLKPSQYDSIDYIWNQHVYVMVREKCELDHALSWLSTLGGAFSALGKLHFMFLNILKSLFFR